MTDATKECRKDKTSHYMTVKEVSAETTLNRITIHNMSKAGNFPKPVKIGAKRIAYIREEIQAFIQALDAGREVNP